MPSQIYAATPGGNRGLYRNVSNSNLSTSLGQYRSRSILDNLPQNLQDASSQEDLKNKLKAIAIDSTRNVKTKTTTSKRI